MRRPPQLDLRTGYPVRALVCLVVSLVLVIAVVRLWPASAPAAPVERGDTPAAEIIALEEVVPTRQALSRPPPPAPLPPVIVPDDVLLEDPLLDLSDNPTPTLEFGDAPELREGTDEGPVTTAAESYVGPKAVRLAEPEYPREAGRRKIRAEVVIEVLVDTRGRVQEIEIVDRYLLGEEEADRQRVAEIGYGIEAAARAAAERWLFRPARRNGQAVEAHSTVTFRFGV